MTKQSQESDPTFSFKKTSSRKIVNNVVTRISTPYSTGPLPCPYGCGRSFKHATQKAIHIRKAHTGERPFVCSNEGCDRAFHSSGDLKAHEKTHSGVRDFVCGTCGKALSSRNALRVHERALHTLDRPFKCEEKECGMTYMTKLDLDRHVAKHVKAKARDEKVKLQNLEKRAVKAERTVKQLREKVGKMEKGKWGVKGSGGSGRNSRGGGSGSGSDSKDGGHLFSSDDVDDLLCKNVCGEFVAVVPGSQPPLGAVSYFVPNSTFGRISEDDLVVVKRANIQSALKSYHHPSASQGGKSSSRGFTLTANTAGAEASSLGGPHDLTGHGDPTVQGVFAARDALALANNDHHNLDGNSDSDDENLTLRRLLLQPIGGVGGTSTGNTDRLVTTGTNNVGNKRPRAQSEDTEKYESKAGPTKRNAVSPAVLRRRVLEKRMRLEYDAADVKESIPFQSWRRGLSAEAKKRLEAETDAEFESEQP